MPRAEHVWKLVVKLVRMVLGQPSGSGPCIVAVTMIRRRQRRRKMAMLCYEYVMFHKFGRLIPFWLYYIAENIRMLRSFEARGPSYLIPPTVRRCAHQQHQKHNDQGTCQGCTGWNLVNLHGWLGSSPVLQFPMSPSRQSERRLVEPRNPESTLELSPMPKLPQTETKSFQGRGSGTLAVKLPELNSEFEGFSHDFLTEIMKN